MYTEFNSQNVNKDPKIYVTEEEKTPMNKILGVVWKILLVVIILILLFLALIKFGVISLNSDVAPNAILLNQNEIGIKKGKGYQLIYTVLPENSTNKQVVFESSNPNVVRVNEVTGYLEALKNGTAKITVKTLINQVLSECVVTVGNKNILATNITVNEKYISLATGYSTTLSYRTTPSNATEIGLSFSSSDESVAKVDTKGRIKGIKEGNAVITVSSSNGAVKDTAYVTVYKKGTTTVAKGTANNNAIYPSSINIQEENINLSLGTTSQLTTSISPSNATKEVTWSSSNANVATVNSNGLVTARGSGTTTIVARTINGKTDTCTVTVGKYSVKLRGILITTKYTSLPVDVTKQLFVAFTPSNATNKSITWTSSNPSVASVDQSGNVKALKSGSAIITATSSDGGYKSTTAVDVINYENEILAKSLSFGNSSYSIGVNNTLALKPIITPSNATSTAIEFVSDNPSIATVNMDGVVTGVKEGSATITATLKRTQLKASVTVNIHYIKATGVNLNAVDVQIPLSDTYTLVSTVLPSNASDKTVIYKSDNPNIATVDNHGIIKGVSKGKTTITVTPKGGGNSSTCLVTVY